MESSDDENTDDEAHRLRRSKRNPSPEKEEEAGAAELNELLGRIRKEHQRQSRFCVFKESSLLVQLAEIVAGSRCERR